MLDIKKLRDDTQSVAKALKKRGYILDVAIFEQLEAERKDLQARTQELQADRNARSKEIGKIKAQGGDASEVLAQVASLGDELKQAEEKLKLLLDKINHIMLDMPNIPSKSVPVGKDESDNVEIRREGAIPTFDFPIRDHVEIGQMTGRMDFATAAKLTGSRFVVMHGSLVRLHRALIQFMLDTHAFEHNYHEMYVPYIVNQDSLHGTGQLPKFSEDLFALNTESTEQDYYLIPTGEVPLTNLYRNEIIDESHLPIQLVTHTPCFRSEAGSYGKDTRGMIRQHQFEKVELVNLVHPKDGLSALERLTGHAETILQKLQLPYRVLSLCTGDMGATARKTYDLEVWIPSQNTYREISSCSWCGDFQARRMQTRYKSKDMKKPELVHTLNGSGLAVGRALVAIIENYQQSDGSIVVPQVLRRYMNGMAVINAK
jgi:seryl-tRNA synthetase